MIYASDSDIEESKTVCALSHICTDVITHMRAKMMNVFVFMIAHHERDSTCERLTAASHAIRIVRTHIINISTRSPL